jgi:hypothetical protein
MGLEPCGGKSDIQLKDAPRNGITKSNAAVSKSFADHVK